MPDFLIFSFPHISKNQTFQHWKTNILPWMSKCCRRPSKDNISRPPPTKSELRNPCQEVTQQMAPNVAVINIEQPLTPEQRSVRNNYVRPLQQVYNVLPPAFDSNHSSYNSSLIVHQNMPIVSIHTYFLPSWWIDFGAYQPPIDWKEMVWLSFFAKVAWGRGWFLSEDQINWRDRDPGGT